jgi:nucleotide-binding universal stress UspA family protein
MLAAVAETSADLLVMGAYGENRLSAMFGLGRATRKVITAAAIPLLTQR